MDADQFAYERYCLLAEIAKALGHPHRMILMEHLAQGERSVERLAELSNLSMANASQHLKQLRNVGLVAARREGKNVLYCIGKEQVFDIFTALRSVAQASASPLEASELAFDDSALISREELESLLSVNTAVLIDVRPEEEFALGHLPDALSVPFDSLSAGIASLDRSRIVVAYCRGPYCLLSRWAVRLLRSHGFDARHFEGGVPAWRAAGLNLH